MRHRPHLRPAFRAEYLHPPALRGGDDGGKVTGRATLEREEHGCRIVETVIEHQALAHRVHGIDVAGEVDHRVDDVTAASGHSARGSFVARGSPMFPGKAIDA